MIDNSSSMAKSQAQPARATSRRSCRCSTALPGGLPNVHIAVVSSDMGAGQVTAAATATARPASSRQRRCARRHPATTTLTPARASSRTSTATPTTPAPSRRCSPASPRWARTAAASSSRCSRSRTRSAPTTSTPPVGPSRRREPGFLRDDAYLAIILITNEDDCSAPGGAASELFRDRVRRNLPSTLGPPTGYRCNAFGHLCGNRARAARSPSGRRGGDVDARVTLDGCVPAQRTGTMPLLGGDVRRGHQAAQARPATTRSWSPPSPDPTTPSTRSPGAAAAATRHGPWPAMCTPASRRATSATPTRSVRISEWVKQFGRNGVIQSICDDSFRSGDDAHRRRDWPRSSAPSASPASSPTGRRPDERAPVRLHRDRPAGTATSPRDPRLRRRQRRPPLLAPRRGPGCTAAARRREAPSPSASLVDRDGLRRPSSTPSPRLRGLHPRLAPTPAASDPAGGARY